MFSRNFPHMFLLIIVGIITALFSYTPAQDLLTAKTFVTEKQTGNCEDSKSNNCAHIKLEYFKVEMPSNLQVQKKINSSMKKEMLVPVSGEEIPKNVDELVEEFINGYKIFKQEFPDSWQQWEVERTAKVIYQDDKILSSEIFEYSYLGEAHPNSNVNFYNFNLQAGELIKLSDLFIEGYEDELNKIAEKIFRKEKNLSNDEDLSKAGYWFEKNIFKVNNNFSLNGKQITFMYNAYEIAPYAMGTTELIIPYFAIKNLIREDGILNTFLKN